MPKVKVISDTEIQIFWKVIWQPLSKLKYYFFTQKMNFFWKKWFYNWKDIHFAIPLNNGGKVKTTNCSSKERYITKWRDIIYMNIFCVGMKRYPNFFKVERKDSEQHTWENLYKQKSCIKFNNRDKIDMVTTCLGWEKYGSYQHVCY